EGATFCGRPVLEWLDAAGARPEDVWPDAAEPAGLTVWDARLFPAVSAPGDYRQWLWMYEPETVTEAARRQWLAADRYSMADMAGLVDLEAFFDRRADIRAENLARSPHRLFRPES